MDSVAQLAAELADWTPHLVAYTIDHACSGTFWEERFGERGRKHIAADTAHHLEYLITALQLGTPSVMEGYARWLQSILTVRGMCTRHIEMSFDALTTAIGRDVPHSDLAVDYMNAALAALAYRALTPRAIQERSAELVREATRLARTRAASQFRSSRDVDPSRVERDVTYLLSYLTDAVALQRPDVFQNHTGWIAGYHVRRGHSEQYLPTLLTALTGAANRLPEAVRQEVRALIAQAK
jgi:hypothetical protein